MSEQVWRLLTHDPKRILRWAPSDDPAWIRVQRLTISADDSATDAKVTTLALQVDELIQLIADIDKIGNEKGTA